MVALAAVPWMAKSGWPMGGCWCVGRWCVVCGYVLFCLMVEVSWGDMANLDSRPGFG